LAPASRFSEMKNPILSDPVFQSGEQHSPLFMVQTSRSQNIKPKQHGGFHLIDMLSSRTSAPRECQPDLGEWYPKSRGTDNNPVLRCRAFTHRGMIRHARRSSVST
jgi:hypothetical protein